MEKRKQEQQDSDQDQTKNVKVTFSHWIPNKVPTFEGTLKEDNLSTYSYTPFTKEDVESTYHVALRLRRRIAELDDPKKGNSQSSAFFRLIKQDPKTKEHYLTSASGWDLEGQIAVRMYLQPVDDPCCVIPSHRMSAIEEMKKKSSKITQLLDPNINEQFIRKGEFGSVKSQAVRRLLTAIRKLIFTPMIKDVSDEDLASEDKHEVKTDVVVRELLNLLGINDPVSLPFALDEESRVTTKLGPYPCSSKIEFLVVPVEPKKTPEDTPVYIRVEDKRLTLQTNSTFSTHVAQRACEAICIALRNYDLRNSDQEVFGIGVRHRFFTFWHSYFDERYLQKLRLDPQNLTPELFGVLKQFPISQYGYDICKPDEREQIVRLLCAIFGYLQYDHKVGRADSV